MIVRILDKIIAWIQALKESYLKIRIEVMKRANERKKWDDDSNSTLYVSPAFSEGMLNSWGKDTVWKEIKLLIALCEGKILDIACGTGEVIHQLRMFEKCEIHGCDIVKELIDKTKEKGISEKRLQVCDALKLPYPDLHFDYAYSIGSFHVMSEETRILSALKESHRVTKNAFFLQVPTSRKNKDEGWIRVNQHFFNNSADWWLKKCKSVYDKVTVLDSQWRDVISDGKWFLCFKKQSLN